MENIFKLISDLTKIDIQHKTIFELLSSIAEEYGELAREIKIEEKTFGNTYKQPDEGSIVEAIDVVITGLAVYFARGGKAEEIPELISKKLKKWAEKQAFSSDNK